ncbi:MAG: amino acid permease [Alphaproteobacteria bacterium]|nr:amino acid permease [Alphaproteobacteria bacterium]
MSNGLFRKKNVNFIRDVSDHTKLKKTLGAFDLLCIGLGAVIGTGVFVLTGVNAAVAAGPAVTVSFIIAGITCIFVALAYTEVAAALPSSGGSYTYAYVALGEIAAWVVGWAVIVQIGFGSTTVASGWSGYIVGVLAQMDIFLPEVLIKTPFEGGIIDLPAFLICVFLTAVVYRGTHESSMLNIILVIIKLSAILLFIIIASGHFDVKNWGSNLKEFMPFGFKGVTLAAGAVFLSYTGFDVVANATEESKNPSRDVTIGLIGSIFISMIVYVSVAGLVTGIAYYADLNNKEPLAFALKVNGSNITGTIVAIGGIIGMTTVILVQIFGLSRVFMAMSRDGLFPKMFNKIHPKYATPHIGTLIVGVGMGLISGLVPIKTMGDLASLGTLFVLVIITISTVMLRRSRPNIKRPFRCPGLPVIAPLALLLCGYLAFNLLMSIGWIFGIYMLLGLLIYFTYSRKGANKIYTKNH